MTRPFRLQRRALLRGIAGAAMALPALEIMRSSSSARAADASPPKRFVMIYGGMSLGAPYAPHLVIPDEVGLGYDLKRGLLPLGAGALPQNPGPGGMGLNVQDHVSIVSGLRVPWGSTGNIPAGGRLQGQFHFNTMGPQTSGMRAGPGFTEAPNGPTADQIVAAAISDDDQFVRSLSYRVQVRSYYASNGTGGDDSRISWRESGSGLERVDPIYSPQLAYSSLFGAWPGLDPDTIAAGEFSRRRRVSVVDLVQDRLKALIPKLGAADRQRLERHVEEVHGLAERLAAIPPDGQGDCSLPADPGEDPPIGGAALINEDGEYVQTGTGGYSGEDLRAEILFDLITMAFACDQTRAAAVRMTFSQSLLVLESIIGSPGMIHSHAHSSGQQIPYADCFGWHVKHFARLVAKLRDTQDIEGASLLDNTAVVMLFEGGYGPDVDGSNTENVTHCSDNMVALVGGHAGGLNPTGGKHIVATGQHPAKAVISAMVACGVAQETKTLGEVTGDIPELFS